MGANKLLLTTYAAMTMRTTIVHIVNAHKCFIEKVSTLESKTIKNTLIEPGLGFLNMSYTTKEK